MEFYDQRTKRATPFLKFTVKSVAFLTICAGFALTTFVNKEERLPKLSDELSRRLEEDCEETESVGIYVLLYIAGVLYMFVALAIVCDEFFVPALEVISIKWKLTNDIAGATLMAAGGSAPELFTSLMGTFQESSVGFGTIVGSAVFNVMFVIGVCAVSSSEALDLNWWPLARDCTYYAAVLFVLAAFMQDTKIVLWEAVVLFALYFGYVFIMKYNIQLYRFLLTSILRKDAIAVSMAMEELSDADGVSLNKPTGFRAGLLNFITGKGSMVDTAGTAIVCEIAGDVEETFRKLDTDGSGTIEPGEIGNLLSEVTGHKATVGEIEILLTEVDKDGDGNISWTEFVHWYMASSARIEKDVRTAFKAFDKDHSGFLNSREVELALIQLNGSAVDQGEVAHAVADLTRGSIITSDGVPLEVFSNYYKTSTLRARRETVMKEQAEACTGLNLKWPSEASFVGKITYLFTLPLVFAMYWTIPDVRVAGWGQYGFSSFTMSIIWIGFYSYLMVSWATTVGETFGIPDVVMGLTFLAAGTSVPDLLSSVIVAKQGHGDMAVSSSIGSNIFDVLIGLPFPWMAYCIYHQLNNALGDANNQTFVSVGADGVAISIVILVFMLGIIVMSVAFNKWRMTKQMGYFYFCCYAGFVAQELARTDWSQSDC